MQKRYRPLVDRLFWITTIIAVSLLLGVTVAVCFYPDGLAIAIVLAVDLLTLYVVISPLFGYVELREKTVFIKFGLILKKEILYDKIRGVKKERRCYSESIISLKSAMEHVDIKYDGFQVVTVSVVDNDSLIEEIKSRIG